METEKKTIIAPITLVVGGEDKAPGTPVTLDAKEADSLIDRFGATEVDPEEGEAVSAKPGKGGKKAKAPAADGGEGSAGGDAP